MAYILPQLLTESRRKFPDKVAVSCSGKSLTYSELDEQSNRLAHLLRREGVRPADRVAIFLSKSVETVVAIFSILKAGAAYVPVDPQAPVTRLGLILQNCGTRHLLTSAQKLSNALSGRGDLWGIECAVLMDDSLAKAPAMPSGVRCRSLADSAREPAHLLGNSSIETDLAYILYTSGSTGVPKGVMITHRNALTFIDWARDCFEVGPEDRLSNHAPFHFDLSVFDLFVSVKAGATVYIVPESIAFFPADLVRFMESNGITVWYSVPSALTLLVRYGKLAPGRLPRLRTILFAGEVFPSKYLRAILPLFPQARFFNLYGPTETNVCTYYEVKEPPAGDEPIPIGRACANTEVFALDAENRRVGVGEEGILYARGPCVMKGYWGLPQKTAEMVSDWRDDSGHTERIYRTGDVVILGEDGDYRFLGRRDHMVKSRGYRIELGEIETALHSHPGVVEAVVVAIPDAEIGNRLHAIVVCSDTASLTASDVVRHCGQRIPKYMIPERIEFRPELPKTSTGKIDRQGLLQEFLRDPASDTGGPAP